LSPLKKACSDLELELVVCDEGAYLEGCLKEANPIAIIVTLSSKEHGGQEALDFANAISQLLQPEDADILIVYSSITGTPEPWRLPADPHPILSAWENRRAVEVVYNDREWCQSIGKMVVHQRTFRYPHVAGRIVEINPNAITGKDASPFPTEAGFLLRGALKEMSTISVASPRHGFSGAMVFTVEGFEQGIAVPKKFFAKIYPDEQEALREYDNYKNYVERYVARHYRPHYNDDRRLCGLGYSIVVMDLVSDSNDDIVTLLDLIQDDSYDLASTESFASALLRVLRESWGAKVVDEQLDLIHEYLAFLEKENQEARVRAIQSEDSCNRWFGTIFDDPDIRGRISSYLSEGVLIGSKSKPCHGDLHCDNVLVDGKTGNLIPVLIDYAKTKTAHFLKDLVTLECDIIIRGPDGIAPFSKPEIVREWITSLDSPRPGNMGDSWEAVDESEFLRVKKATSIIGRLRSDAQDFYRATPTEYFASALLKTLNIISHRNLRYDRTVRAAQYVRYLSKKLSA